MDTPETMAHDPLTLLLVLPHGDRGHDDLLLRILLADADLGDLTTIAPACVQSAEDLMRQGVCDAALVMAPFGDDDDLAILRRLVGASPSTPVLAIAETPDRPRTWKILDTGARDCLSKAELSSALLSRAIRYALEVQRHAAARRQLERYDPLTGLLTHGSLFAVIERFHHRCRRGDFSFALLVIGIHDHAPLRRRRGHVFAEEVMVELAHRLESTARPGDVVARLGDEGFVLVLPSVTDAHQAETVGQRCGELLRNPLDIRQEQICVDVRTGFALHGPRVREAAFDGPHDMLGAAILESKLAPPSLGVS